MKFIENIFDWIWVSSADPSKVSLTVKSVLTMLATVLSIVLGFGNIHLGPDAFNSIIDAIVQTIQYGFLAVAAIGTFIGGVRKLWYLVGSLWFSIKNSPVNN